MALTQISTKGIKDGTILNADVNASAAIAGTKISPNFGSQNTTTTGIAAVGELQITSTAPKILFIDSDTDPDYELRNMNGVFRLRDSTNDIIRITQTGSITDIAGHVDVGAGLDVTGGITASNTGNASLILDAGTGSQAGNQVSFIDFKLDGTLKANIAVNEGGSHAGDLEINSAGTGATKLFHAGSEKFETTSTGINVTGSQIITNGNLTVNNGTNQQVTLEASNGSIEITRASGGAFIDFKNSTSEDNDARIQEASGGFHFSGSSQIGTNLTVLNDLIMGGEFNMTSGGNKNRFFDCSLADAEALHLRSTQGGDQNHENMAQFHRNAGVHLFYDNFLKFKTIATGARIQNTGTANRLGTTAGDSSDLLQLHQEDVSNTTTYDFMNFRFANGSTHATSEMRFRRHVDVTDQGYFGLRDLALTFGYGNSEKMRMNSNGDFLVGNNSPNVIARISSSSPQFGAFFETTGNTAAHGIPLIVNRQADNGVMIEFKQANGVVATISRNSSNQMVYGGTSDYRLKENNVAISDSLTKVRSLKPYEFNWKDRPDTKVLGFFAHELQEVVPQAVTGTKDEMYEDDDTKPKYQNVDNSHIVPLLVAAVQELTTKTEALETEVAALKAS